MTIIEPSVAGVLGSRYTRRRFFLISSVAIVLLIVVDGLSAHFLSVGALREALIAVFSAAAANLATIMLIYGVWLWVTPNAMRHVGLLEVRSREIRERIEQLAAGADEYWFLGRSGRYFRAVVLPTLSSAAQRDRRRIHIRIVLPNPDHERNTQLYCHMMLGLQEEATENTLHTNVLATIVSAVHASRLNPYLRIDIALSASVPVLRYDISNGGALVTRDAKHLPAIYADGGSQFHEMFRDAVENEFSQGKSVFWNAAFHITGSAVDSTELILAHTTGLPTHSEGLIGEVTAELQAGAHRYG